MIDTDLVETKTINLRYVNKILCNCPNYDKIVNYDYEYGDTFSSKLIDWYRELVFSCDGENANQLSIIYQIDRGLSLYVEDNQYKRGLSQIITKDDIDLNKRLKSLSKEKRVKYIDCYSLLEKDGKLNSTYTDNGVYLNKKGYEVLIKNINSILG